LTALAVALASPAYAAPKKGVTPSGTRYTTDGRTTKGVTPGGVRYTTQKVRNEKGSFQIYRGLGCGRLYAGDIPALRACQQRVLNGGRP
jgi:hypothetical protein